MNPIWQTDLETMMVFFKMVNKIEKDFGKELNRAEREFVFFELMKVKGQEPCGHTELNKEEFLEELVSKHKKILNIDESGVKIIKEKTKGEEK